MKNEYGITLDRNGYAPSILDTSDGECFVCKRSRETCRHELIHGVAYRKKAKALGLWVNVCSDCHYAIHNSNGELDRELKRTAQSVAVLYYGWDFADFRERFGKSYI